MDGERRAPRVRFLVGVGLIVLGAALVRAPLLPSALPYMSYIDEGYVLHPSARMISHLTWDPGWYLYPSFVIDATSASALAYRVVTGDRAITQGATRDGASGYYDLIEPRELLVVSRVVVLSFALGTVVLVALLGRLLIGSVGGLLAAVVAALAPALVSRSAIVIVDTPAAFFCLASLLFAGYARLGRRVILWTASSGAAAGLAFTSKYPGIACLAGLLTVLILWHERSVRERVRLAAVAIVAAIGTAVLAMPALVLRPQRVVDDVREVLGIYDGKSSISYWRALVSSEELGIAVCLVSLVGLVVLLRSSRARPLTCGYLVFAGITLAALLPQDFQPFRNVLTLVPFLCVATAAGALALGRTVASRVSPPGRAVEVGVATVVVVALATSMLVGGVRPLYDDHFGIVDTRVSARRWLQDNIRAGDDVLVAEELAFLPSELAALDGDVAVRPAVEPLQAAEARGFEYVVSPIALDDPAPTWQTALSGYTAVSDLGESSTPVPEDLWRGNDQRIVIYASPSAGAAGES